MDCNKLIQSTLVFAAGFGLTLFGAQAETTIMSDTLLSSDIFDNVVIAADDVTLDCQGNSIRGFPPFNGISISGKRGVKVKNCTVEGFFRGIFVSEGSSVTAQDITLRGNALSGLEATESSHVALRSGITSTDNGVFGLFFSNNTSVNVTEANLVLNRNIGGLQLGLNSSLFVVAQPPLAPSSITALNNTTFGMTVVSNSHFFVFGPSALEASNNGTNGISLFSKSAIELDNGASLRVNDNAKNGVLLEDSTLNMFNMPQFGGAFLEAKRNQEAGVGVEKLSVFDMSADSSLISIENEKDIFGDDGSSLRIISSTVGSVGLSFGARAEFQGNQIERVRCDRSVLTRGDERCRRGFRH